MAKTDTALISLPNLGETLVEKLKAVGIETPENLKNIGSENAFIKLSTVDSDACLNMLYALVGAIQGIRWHALSTSIKNELKVFYNMTTRKDNLRMNKRRSILLKEYEHWQKR